MEQKRRSIHFAFSQTQLVVGKIAPPVALPHQAKFSLPFLEVTILVTSSDQPIKFT